MLHDPTRHEALRALPWDPARVRAAIEWIVTDTEARFRPGHGWPWHPLDLDAGDDPASPATALYFGAAGVIWALRYLQDVGAAPAGRRWSDELEPLRLRNREWLTAIDCAGELPSYLMGDTPIRLMQWADAPGAELADALAGLIDGNRLHPSRELMWGSPGTLLAALFLHEREGDPGWAELFRRTTAQLWSEMSWSEEHGCHYWPQKLYGRDCAYLDAVHGFVATALPLIRGRHLLGDAAWQGWSERIVQTVRLTATREGGGANWRTDLFAQPLGTGKVLMQYCHGSPGFVICLAGLPDPALDQLLLEAGEATWRAGPLAKGSNLCHGTAGNGYAFLKLHERTGDERWLDRARAFAMHAIAQAEEEAHLVGHLRYSLWTGDPGLAIYLWDCLRAKPAFPTLDVFWADKARGDRVAAGQARSVA
jgi:hypothetical protein